MSTVRTCCTPKDGWALVSHFLGNLLLVISSQCEVIETLNLEEGSDERYWLERVIDDAQAKLVGSLYMITRRMRNHGHDDDAAKIQQLVDMVAAEDLTNPDSRAAIHAKHKESDSESRNFEAELAKLRAEHAKSD
jgi:hypothetical protein